MAKAIEKTTKKTAAAKVAKKPVKKVTTASKVKAAPVKAEKPSKATSKAQPVSKSTVKVSKDLFAIANVGKAQHKLYQGATYEIKKVDAKAGDTFETEEVLLVADGDKVMVGKPYVKGAKVTLRVVTQKRGPKVDTFIYKAKARYRRSHGSRPHLTDVRVETISY